MGAFLGYIGVAKSENALSFAELARVEITSLATDFSCPEVYKGYTSYFGFSDTSYITTFFACPNGKKVKPEVYCGKVYQKKFVYKY